MEDLEIIRLAREKYHRRYSGFIDEQIELDRTRKLQIDSFVLGFKEAVKQGKIIKS